MMREWAGVLVIIILNLMTIDMRTEGKEINDYELLVEYLDFDD